MIVRAEAESMDDLGKMVVSKIQLIDGITRTRTCPSSTSSVRGVFDADVEHFNEHGWVLVPSLIPAEDIDAAQPGSLSRAIYDAPDPSER